jgi:transposase
MRAYSLDLRQRIVAAVQSGLNQKAAADRFAVSTAAVSRYLRQHRDKNGDLSPKPIPGRARGIAMAALLALEQYLKEHPDLTLEQARLWLREQHQIEVSRASVHRTLVWRGWTHKKSRWWPPSEMRQSALLGETR